MSDPPLTVTTMTDTPDNRLHGIAQEHAGAALPKSGEAPGPRISVVRGDITAQQVEAIVTAANEPLRGGGGVGAAVHAAAGPELLRACRALAPCPTGSAVITPAFQLAPVRWVIHAVGPIYRGPEDADLLASAYRSSLARADEVGATSIAFPAISTGVYGYPAEQAAEVSVAALRAASTQVEHVLLVAFAAPMAALWQHALDKQMLGDQERSSRGSARGSRPRSFEANPSTLIGDIASTCGRSVPGS